MENGYIVLDTNGAGQVCERKEAAIKRAGEWRQNECNMTGTPVKEAELMKVEGRKEELDTFICVGEKWAAIFPVHTVFGPYPVPAPLWYLALCEAFPVHLFSLCNNHKYFGEKKHNLFTITSQAPIPGPGIL